MSTSNRNELAFPYIGTYNPWTSFQKFFNINPNIDIDFFGSNTEDAPIEQHVLNEIGSYGKQLSTVIEMLNVVAQEQDLSSHSATLDDKQKTAVENFDMLREKRRKAVANYKLPRDLTLRDLDRVKAFIAYCKRHHNSQYEELQESLKDE
ncbi:hypothetical protein VDG1235_199 [Verrucomicrobiia bacterium DG1235]|nr:hypothetical protein VDG1235_199 [Verrucomicrobiae bacterium DG1235]